MRQPAQHGQPLARGVGPGRQPLVRQRLPRREIADGVLADQRAECGGQFLRLASSRRDRQREPAGRLALGYCPVRRSGAGERRNQQRAKRGRRDQVPAEVRERGSLIKRLPKLRVSGNHREKSGEGHCVLTEAARNARAEMQRALSSDASGRCSARQRDVPQFTPPALSPEPILSASGPGTTGERHTLSVSWVQTRANGWRECPKLPGCAARRLAGARPRQMAAGPATHRGSLGTCVTHTSRRQPAPRTVRPRATPGRART